MERTIKERLLEFISYLGMGQTKFERSAGLSNGYVNNIKKSPSMKILQRIFGTYPQLNKDWLLTGEGSMLNTKKYEIVDDEVLISGPEVIELRKKYAALEARYAALEATLAKKEAQIDILLNELKQKQK